MARTLTKTTVLRADAITDFASPENGKWVWAERPVTSSLSKLLTLTSERADIRRNPMVNGFRMASPYYAFGQNNGLSLLTGDCLWQENNYELGKTSVPGGTVCDYEAPDPSGVDVISSIDKDRKIIQLLNKIGDQKWNAGESLISARENVDMIGNSANRLFRAYLYARNKNWKGVARVLGVKPPKKMGAAGKSSASGWLEFQFGWLPLIDDIVQGAIWLSDVDTKPLQLSAKVSLRDTIKMAPVSSLENLVFATNRPYVRVAHETRTEISEDWKASIYYDVALPKLRELAKHGIVGASTPWAVVPMSFVIDWFLPIGDILSALDATYGLNFRTGSQTSFKRSKSTRKSTGTWFRTSKLFYTNRAKLESLSADRYRMTRTVMNRTPSVMTFYVKNPLSVGKVVTATALARQLKSH